MQRRVVRQFDTDALPKGARAWLGRGPTVSVTLPSTALRAALPVTAGQTATGPSSVVPDDADRSSQAHRGARTERASSETFAPRFAIRGLLACGCFGARSGVPVWNWEGGRTRAGRGGLHRDTLARVSMGGKYPGEQGRGERVVAYAAEGRYWCAEACLIRNLSSVAGCDSCFGMFDLPFVVSGGGRPFPACWWRWRSGSGRTALR